MNEGDDKIIAAGSDSGTPGDGRGGGGRVPAGILFGDLKGSTEEAEHDERSTVEKLRQYEQVVNETAQSFGPDFYKVKTEGDGFMATFATAHAMVQCGFAVQREFRRRGWQVRLGGHYGEVYRNQSGDSVGADVNRAARIQSAADATRGQFLVSDAVKAIVRDRLRELHFEPHAAITAKGVPEALVVFEVLPAAAAAGTAVHPPPKPHKETALRPHPTLPGGSAHRAWIAAAALVLVVAAGTAFLYLRPRFSADDIDMIRPIVPPRSTAPAAASDMIAVLEFENQRPDDAKSDWFCKALQTAFNTELSKIPEVSVVAPEIIHGNAKKAGTDPMTAARRLGATRFVTGSFAVMGNTLRIDARIVGQGLQEAAESIEGNQDQFFALQKQLALATMDHLKVKLSIADKAALKEPSKARLDKYRMLLDAEGVTGSAAAPSTTPAGPTAGRAARHTLAFDWSWSTAAYAQTPPEAAEAAVRAVLDEYRQAHESGDLDRLESLYVKFPASQRESLGAYLQGVKQLHVELADIKIQQREHDIAVSYTRRDNFIDSETGEPVALEVRVTKFLVPSGTTWKFAEGG